MICSLGKGTYQVGGMRLIVKGRQASRKEAPILVVAPHSTFLDAGITYVTGFPSIIVRRESGLNPFIGSTYGPWCWEFANIYGSSLLTFKKSSSYCNLLLGFQLHFVLNWNMNAPFMWYWPQWRQNDSSSRKKNWTYFYLKMSYMLLFAIICINTKGGIVCCK